MKQLVKTSRTAGYLEKMFRALNAEFFAGEEIEEPIITIQSTKGAYGHVTVAKVWKAKDSAKHELNIGADTLERPIENVASTLLHEMVHLYNMAHEVQDCSRGGSYHNKKFKAEAEKRGLLIEYRERYGWTTTKPSDKLLDFILLNGWTEIEMNRGSLPMFVPTGAGKAGDGGEDEQPKKPRAKSSTRKYKCPCCGLSVRATKVVFVKCIECDEQLLEV